jgi:hypothetical protein
MDRAARGNASATRRPEESRRERKDAAMKRKAGVPLVRTGVEILAPVVGG